MHAHRPPVTDRKVRFAALGCGRIAGNHLDAIAQHAERPACPTGAGDRRRRPRRDDRDADQERVVAALARAFLPSA